MGAAATTEEIALALVRQHGQPIPTDEGLRLAGYAEWPHVDDWTLRSALVRLAQPEPLLGGALLEAARRLDAALHPLTRSLEQHLVVCDAGLSSVTDDAPAVGGTPAEPYVDARATDLARLAAHPGISGDDLTAAYDRHEPLDDDEITAVPLLGVAVEIDRLARALAAWAANEPRPAPPVAAVDATIRTVVAQLDTIGVPHEEDRRPPPRRRAAS